MSSNWNDTERLVQLIERSINPSSRVLSNQYLPVLKSESGRRRQCDVVIVTGTEKRKTTTLVEIQDRGSAVDINTFNGWLEKLKEVGAQHLICVSKRNFPISIKEKAASLGSTVMLVKLQELANVEDIPLQLFNSKLFYSDFQLRNIGDVNFTFDQDDVERHNFSKDDLNNIVPFRLNDKIFSTNRHDLISLYNISQDYLRTRGFYCPEDVTITLEEPCGIYILVNNTFVLLRKLSFNCRWKREPHEISPTVMAYEQFESEVLAWVLEFSYQDSDKFFWFKIPAIKDGDTLSISSVLARTSHGRILLGQIFREYSDKFFWFKIPAIKDGDTLSISSVLARASHGIEFSWPPKSRRDNGALSRRC